MIASALCVGTIAGYHSGIGGVRPYPQHTDLAADQQGGFMVVRFKNDDGSAGYETIDFRETMPAAGNETVCPLHKLPNGAGSHEDVLSVRRQPDQEHHRRSRRWRPWRAPRLGKPTLAPRLLALCQALCARHRPRSQWLCGQPRPRRLHRWERVYPERYELV